MIRSVSVILHMADGQDFVYTEGQQVKVLVEQPQPLPEPEPLEGGTDA